MSAESDQLMKILARCVNSQEHEARAAARRARTQITQLRPQWLVRAGTTVLVVHSGKSQAHVTKMAFVLQPHQVSTHLLASGILVGQMLGYVIYLNVRHVEPVV